MSVTFAVSNLRNSMPVDQYVVMKLGVSRINFRYFRSSLNFNEFLLFLFIYNFIHLSFQVSSDLLLVFLYMHNKANFFFIIHFTLAKGYWSAYEKKQYSWNIWNTSSALNIIYCSGKPITNYFVLRIFLKGIVHFLMVSRSNDPFRILGEHKKCL